ncbi:uncharacterized protein LOC143033942 isoform X2 [Oratosquilla oratoria]|uniref:uncharacterized protein LOC143033942 isoform X2 n=1 Tax=Oratosquilla oratoria TaxID=337810 RepID=UPI003F76AF7E
MQRRPQLSKLDLNRLLMIGLQSTTIRATRGIEIGTTSTEAMEEEVVNNPCGICSNTLDEGETVKLRAKGADTINKASTERGTPSITVSEGQTVHIDC